MTMIELEAMKATLARQILTEIDSEDMVRKMQTFFQRLKSEKASYSMPIDLLEDLMAQAEKDDAGLCITSEELDKEMEAW